MAEIVAVAVDAGAAVVTAAVDAMAGTAAAATVGTAAEAEEGTSQFLRRKSTRIHTQNQKGPERAFRPFVFGEKIMYRNA
jgi:pyruvate carboxylase